MVTMSNYEEYLMLDADDELDAAGKEALAVFIAANPALAGEAAAWHSLKLGPDAELGYADKKGLLKEAPKAFALTWKPFLLAAAAAVAALLIFLAALWRNDHPVSGVGFVIIPKPVVVQGAAPEADTALRVAVVTPAPEQAARRPLPQRRTKTVRLPAAQRPATSRDSIAVLPIVASWFHAALVGVAAPLSTLPEDAVSASSTIPEKQSAPRMPRIQLAAANQPALDMLRAGIETRIAQIAAAAHSLKETTVAIRLGNSSIHLNF